MDTPHTHRREFLKKTAVMLPSAGAALISQRVMGANDRLAAGIMGVADGGCRWRSILPNAPISISPMSAIRFETSRQDHLRSGKDQKTVSEGATDFRQVLDDKDVDIIVNATPDHWHALGTIMACRAGKHVYVEKPLTHNIREGRKMIEAARKYGRIVQLGIQNRSAPYAQAAVEYLRSGSIGDIHLIRVLNMKHRGRIDRKDDEPVPDGVNYDMWLGPAPDRPFNPNHFHGRWHWYWNYSGGDIINDGIHQVDLARMISGLGCPRSVYSLGGKYCYDDNQETPDTQHVLYEYDNITMTFELTLWTPYMKKTPGNIRDTDQFPDWMFNATRIEVYGTDGMMMMGRHGGGWQAFGEDGKMIERPGRMETERHLDNFITCIRSGGRPNGDIGEGHISTILCHLGNISSRLGGRKLAFDPESETFVGDNEANRFLGRIYREPWAIPDIL